MNFQEQIDRFNDDFYNKKTAVVVYSLFFISSLILRFYFAARLNNPGHGDPAYYLSLAQNLASGRGFVIDYVWHFLVLPENLTHFSNDFWMPLTSIIIWPFLILFGKTLLAALIPSIVFGLGCSIIAYYIGLEYTKSKAISFWSAIITLYAPGLFIYSIATDSSIYYVVFASAAILIMMKSKRNPRLFIVAAILIGLAQWARQDGILLMILLIIMILMSSGNGKSKTWLLIGSLAVYLLIISPNFMINLVYTGKLFVSKTFKIAFVTCHDDIYSYGKDLSLKSYLAWGIGNILLSKIASVQNNVIEILKSFGRDQIAIPIICLFYILLPKATGFKWREFQSPMIFMALLVIFYTSVATFPAMGGALFRSTLAFVPFGIVLAVKAIPGFCKNKILTYIVLSVITLMAVFGSVRLSFYLVDINARIDSDLKLIASAIETEHKSADEIVIMTRNPWEVNYTTKHRSLMIPNNDLETIYNMAVRYRANYLILPAPREALQKIYTGKIQDSRFEFMANIEGTDYKIFKIVLPDN
jgi:4-amino-4-deoxy-L-arabinose transferase-like glycosyltransferase